MADHQPCPYCAGRDVFVENASVSCVYVFCNDCAAKGPPVENGAWDGVGDPRSERAAFRAWNMRGRAKALKTLQGRGY